MKHEERIDEINKGSPIRIDLFSSAIFAVALLIVIIGLGFWTISRIASDQRPEILILSESFVQDFEGNTLLFVDYTVGGIATNATFSDDKMEMYNKLMESLEKTGRVQR